MLVHLQNNFDDQEFDVCSDGSWYYSVNVNKAEHNTLVEQGSLPEAKTKFLFSVDVTDTLLTLYINSVKVTSIHDTSFSSTDQIAFGVYSGTNSERPAAAIFSYFLYTPYSS